MECAPRKRGKHEFQKFSNVKSEAYLESKGEALREGPVTEAEFFVLETIIRHAKDNGKEELISSYLLEQYNFVQTINSSLDPKPLELRQKRMTRSRKLLEHTTTMLLSWQLCLRNK